MESEDEVDIESEFHAQRLAEDVYSDSNEPPSKLALLQPEITQHPWTLEQDWYLDGSSMDEKSRVVIEKMMLEEQYYANGGKSVGKEGFIPEKPTSSTCGNSSQAKPQSNTRKQWTNWEKETFFKGLEIFGRKWSKIAELLPHRSALQVKHFAYSHIKKSEEIPETKPTEETNVANSLTDMVSKATTGQPTVNSSMKKGKRGRPKGSATSTPQLQSANKNGEVKTQLPPEEAGTLSTDNAKKLERFPQSQLVRLTKEESSDNDDVDIDICDTERLVMESESEGFSLNDANKLQAEGDVLSKNFLEQMNSDKTTILKTTRNEKANIINSNMNAICSEQIDAPPSTLNKVIGIEGENGAKEVSENDKSASKSYYQSDEPEIVQTERLDSETAEHDNLDSPSTDEPQTAELENDFPDSSFTIQGSDGKQYELPNPIASKEIDPTNFTEEETTIFCEFFDGRPGIKTAERYLKIRNYIVSAWREHRPSYLFKTQIRNGLKKCGDVNIIGRIHAYLEQIGAINFGCDECQYKRKAKPNRKTALRKKQDEDFAVSLLKKETMSQRKRKVRDIFGVWVDEKEMEGRTIDHEKEEECIVHKELPKLKRMKPSTTYDPFKLVICERFTSDIPAPFEVKVEAGVMITMDVHAHLCKTEVIGLLGGVYDAKNGLLRIQGALSCDSISTGMQCEMDPVSQIEACETFRKQGLRVAGWYHSHPTFPPNPSVRDLETQQSFQKWFSVGKMPFVGFIINPYHTNTVLPASDIKCICVSKPQKLELGDHGLPYQFVFQVTAQEKAVDFLDSILNLVKKYQSNKNKIPLLEKVCLTSKLTYFDQMCQAIEVHLKEMDNSRRDFINRFKLLED